MHDDIYQLRHVYAVGGHRMWLSLWYLQQGDVPFDDPCAILAQQWGIHVLPLIADMWGETCGSLYTYVRVTQPAPQIPHLREENDVGLRPFPCLPLQAGGVISGYAFVQGSRRRSSVRIGGISESLADDGVLVSLGESLLQTVGDRMLDHIPYTGSSGTGWYPGIYSVGHGWGDFVSVQARRSLGTQRSRRRLPGSRPD